MCICFEHELVNRRSPLPGLRGNGHVFGSAFLGALARAEWQGTCPAGMVRTGQLRGRPPSGSCASRLLAVGSPVAHLHTICSTLVSPMGLAPLPSWHGGTCPSKAALLSNSLSWWSTCMHLVAFGSQYQNCCGAQRPSTSVRHAAPSQGNA